MHIRRAFLQDIETLVHHHDAMFRDIYTANGMTVDESAFTAMKDAYREKLDKQLTDDGCAAWVIETGGAVAASASISLFESVPIPLDPNYKIAFMHSVYTEPRFRRRGFAGKLVATIQTYCSEKGINRIDLTASDAGRPLYDSLGFRPVLAAMRFNRLAS